MVARVGCGIQSLLCDQFGLRPDYLSNRIHTLFLNGKPVDNVATAVVREGDRLALSAAMPGLVGATLRKGGCLASFRGSISHQEIIDTSQDCHNGIITVKLFNLLLVELGPLFLQRGVWVKRRDLLLFMKTLTGDWCTSFDRIEKDGTTLSPKVLEDPPCLLSVDRIFLQLAHSR